MLFLDLRYKLLKTSRCEAKYCWLWYVLSFLLLAFGFCVYSYHYYSNPYVDLLIRLHHLLFACVCA